MEDRVNRDIQWLGHIVAQKRKSRIVAQWLDIALTPGEQIIRADHLVVIAQQPRAEMRADESGSSSDKCLQRHPPNDIRQEAHISVWSYATS